MLLSTSGTRTTLPPHTSDAAPVKSKVAPQITAAQGIDYYSTSRTVPTSLHREGHHRRMNRCTVISTLYVIITAPRSRYIYTLCHHSPGGVSIYCSISITSPSSWTSLWTGYSSFCSSSNNKKKKMGNIRIHKNSHQFYHLSCEFTWIWNIMSVNRAERSTNVSYRFVRICLTFVVPRENIFLFVHFWYFVYVNKWILWSNLFVYLLSLNILIWK